MIVESLEVHFFGGRGGVCFICASKACNLVVLFIYFLKGITVITFSEHTQRGLFVLGPVARMISKMGNRFLFKLFFIEG